MSETIKRSDRPYFVLDGNVCALLAAKDHVNLFLYDGAIVPDPEGIITGGRNNKTARTIAYRRGEAMQRATSHGDSQPDCRQQPSRRLAEAQDAVKNGRSNLPGRASSHQNRLQTPMRASSGIDG